MGARLRLGIAGGIALAAVGAATVAWIMSDDPDPTHAPDPPWGEEMGQAFVDFALDPSPDTFAELPLADEVGLGLGDTMVTSRPRPELEDPAAWDVDFDGFRAREGTTSVLPTIADHPAFQTDGGPHPSCVGPNLPPPAEADGLEQLSIQPLLPGDASCLEWYAVDLWVDSDGRIAAVTLDLFEP